MPTTCLISTLLRHERQACSQRFGALLIAVAACFLLLAPLFSSSNSVSGLAVDPSPLQGRLVFMCSVITSTLSSAYKRHVLTRQPVDMLLLNSWLSAAQLIAGLLIGPPLLLLLHDQAISSSLEIMSHALGCVTSGLSGISACSDVQFAYPLLFFITSSGWSGITFLVLRRGGDAPIALGSAFLLPTTILAFVRPVRLPYSWEAPPEQLHSFPSVAAVGMGVGLCLYTFGVWSAPCRGRWPTIWGSPVKIKF